MSVVMHRSDCAVHNEPAYPAGPCDCRIFSGTRPYYECTICGDRYDVVPEAEPTNSQYGHTYVLHSPR